MRCVDFNLWKLQLSYNIFFVHILQFPFPFCKYEHVHASIRVGGAGVFLHKLLRFHQVNFFWRNTSWPLRLPPGCHIIHRSRTFPITCHSANLSLCRRDTRGLYCRYLWATQESGLSSFNAFKFYVCIRTKWSNIRTTGELSLWCPLFFSCNYILWENFDRHTRLKNFFFYIISL